MGNDIKSGFGYVIPATALIGFVIALVAEAFLLSVFFAAGGILVWFIYMQVMETAPPSVMGNFIILFSMLIATGLLLAFGLKMNPHGGYEIIPEGAILSFVILFFGILAGILFNRSRFFEPGSKNQLTEAELKAVEESLGRDGASGEAPKVVVIKSEKPESKKEKEKEPETPPPYYQNPYYYPEDYEYEDDDEYEDEYDDDEYEDEYDDEYEYEDEDEETR